MLTTTHGIGSMVPASGFVMEQSLPKRVCKPTMVEVAQDAGVSPATVARVIYGNGYVSAERRRIVEAAVFRTGYRPNVTARALRTSKSFTIGLVLSQARLNGFHPSVAREVQLEALRHGYTVMTLNSNLSAEMEVAGVRRLIDQHVDAILFCSAINDASVRATMAAGIPTVQIEREMVRGGWLVAIDPHPGMRSAICHLRDLGHRRIAYIGPAVSSFPGEAGDSLTVEAARRAAFCAVIAEARLKLDESLLMLSPYDAPPGRRQPGYTRMRKLLRRRDRPTAVITGGDLLAAGALQAIYEARLRVPEDLSLIGYDDVMAEILSPPLTSIVQPIAELGSIALQLALEGIAEGSSKGRRLEASTGFVIRQSTGTNPEGSSAIATS